jgi:DNA-binding transcriptional regulator LsrR (DeoR family)
MSQRDLALAMGVSLGKANYCLKALMDKGLVKLENFRNNPDKRQYA